MSAIVMQGLLGDEALARRVARGDGDAFALLYGRYQARIEGYCRSILRHDEDARDAAQNTMTKALLALRDEPPRIAVRPWLFRIAHNEAISLMRGRRSHAELGDALEGPGGDPASSIFVREEVVAMLQGVRDLPSRARHALLLRELVDLSYREVALALGVSEGAARQAVYEARVALLAERAGRDESCAHIRQELSFRDGRRRATRKARGHLRGCRACRAWRHEQAQRRRRLCLAPAAGLPLLGSLSSLAGVGGGAAGGGMAGGVKVVATLAVAATTAVPLVKLETAGRTPPERRQTASATPRKVVKAVKTAAAPVRAVAVAAAPRIAVRASATTRPARTSRPAAAAPRVHSHAAQPDEERREHNRSLAVDDEVVRERDGAEPRDGPDRRRHRGGGGAREQAGSGEAEGYDGEDEWAPQPVEESAAPDDAEPPALAAARPRERDRGPGQGDCPEGPSQQQQQAPGDAAEPEPTVQ